MIDAAGGGASAAGDPGAVGAVSDVCAVWSGSLAALGEAIGQMHRNLGAAARSYAITDATVIDP